MGKRKITNSKSSAIVHIQSTQNLTTNNLTIKTVFLGFNFSRYFNFGKVHKDELTAEPR